MGQYQRGPDDLAFSIIMTFPDGLHGVQVPVASAIMTAVRPTTYTIIDYRALEALTVTTEDRSINFYLDYLDYCIRQAGDWEMPLRDFDRALWQWSKVRDKGKTE